MSKLQMLLTMLATRAQIKPIKRKEKQVYAWLRDIVSMLGGDIATDGPDQVGTEALQVRPDGSFTIFVPTHTTYLRDNGLIGVQLGHLILHCEAKPKKITTFQRYNDPRQLEAQQFMFDLLMPEEEFLKFAEKCEDDVYMLSGHFEISLDAVKIRLAQLKE